jgi:holin-like protein
MADATEASASPFAPVRRFGLLALQVALLSVVFAGWLVLGRTWRLPLPAGLLAMLSVLVLLLSRLLPLAAVQRGAGFLLRYIGLLFVPLCVGAVRQLPVLRAQGWAFAGLVVAGTLVGLTTAGLLAQALCHKPTSAEAPEGSTS